jgi:GTP-binding protein HflX
LSEAAGYTVLEEFQQNRFCDPSFCLGRGKAEEIAKLVKNLKPKKVIINNQLKPIQRYNLTKIFGTEVIDRIQLILEIFSKRAGTLEAKYQIELAKLQYELPMARENVRLAKLGELPGFHGLGKYQVDVYETMIKRRISYLKRRLEEIRRRKSMHRRKRRRDALYSIAITGYTFAGKTSLFNYLTKESFALGELLFTTLSTTPRAMKVGGRKILISDTVGFIENLPHLLIDSFYSTLEEITWADSVLLVLDSSDSRSALQRKLLTSVNTLNSIGVFNNSIIPVLNKIDIASDLEESEKMVIELIGVRPVKISAKTGEGIQSLIEEISSRLPPYETIKILIPASVNPNSILGWAFKEADIKSVKYLNDSLCLEISIQPAYLYKIKNLVSKIDGVQLYHLKEANVREGP